MTTVFSVAAVATVDDFGQCVITGSAVRTPTSRRLPGNNRVTLAGLIIAIFGVAFMFGGHPFIATMLLLLAWVLLMLDEDMKSG